MTNHLNYRTATSAGTVTRTTGTAGSGTSHKRPVSRWVAPVAAVVAVVATIAVLVSDGTDDLTTQPATNNSYETAEANRMQTLHDLTTQPATRPGRLLRPGQPEPAPVASAGCKIAGRC